jgi:hypothetical protein
MRQGETTTAAAPDTSAAPAAPAPAGPAAPRDGGPDLSLHVVLVEGADPVLQKWMDDFMAEEKNLAVDHGIPAARVTVETVFELLNKYVKPKPYGPDNLPLPYKDSKWKPDRTRHVPGANQAGPEHNAKHDKLGMFHR